MQEEVVKSPKLDLHGTKHENVFGEVDRFVGDHIIEMKYKSLEIVTGHSQRMKEIVLRTISDYGLTAEVPPYNRGTLIVTLI